MPVPADGHVAFDMLCSPATLSALTALHGRDGVAHTMGPLGRSLELLAACRKTGLPWLQEFDGIGGLLWHR